MKHHLHLLDFRRLSRFELVVTIVGSIEPFISIPQVIKVYKLQSASEYFLWTWVFGLFASFIWALYGVRIKKFPVAITGMLWMMVHGSMTTAVLLYG